MPRASPHDPGHQRNRLQECELRGHYSHTVWSSVLTALLRRNVLTHGHTRTWVSVCVRMWSCAVPLSGLYSWSLIKIWETFRTPP